MGVLPSQDPTRAEATSPTIEAVRAITAGQGLKIATVIDAPRKKYR